MGWDGCALFRCVLQDYRAGHAFGLLALACHFVHKCRFLAASLSGSNRPPLVLQRSLNLHKWLAKPGAGPECSQLDEGLQERGSSYDALAGHFALVALLIFQWICILFDRKCII